MTIGVVSLLILILLLVVATITDIRNHTIYNWNTYPGILLGIGLRWAGQGQTGLEDSLKGFAVCGGLMLLCFMLFGLGGGDLKMMAMVGAFLGFEQGVEALLWTLILGGIFGSVTAIWQVGAVNMLVGFFRHLAKMWKARGWVHLPLESQKTLKQPLWLAPAALLAVFIETWSFWQSMIHAGT